MASVKWGKIYSCFNYGSGKLISALKVIAVPSIAKFSKVTVTIVSSTGLLLLTGSSDNSAILQ
jgi:hypothetical protein